nr:retrotransposon protein, putative, Ty1-copia subclass [Tanacetum cinerariifolium]
MNCFETFKVFPKEVENQLGKSIKSLRFDRGGYPKETMGYSFYNPSENKIFVGQNVEFFESKLLDLKASGILVELLPNARTAGSKWLFKKKTNMDDAVYIFKARLVAKVFTQTYGVDYKETFSPVADIRAIRILIAIATYYDYEIWQMDVKTAFLNGHLSEEVYLKPPEGFVNPKYPNHVCKLKRSICGLKQASRQWNKRFDDDSIKSRMNLFKIGTSRRRSLSENDASKQGMNLKQRSIFEESDFDVQAMMDADYELAARLRAEKKTTNQSSKEESNMNLSDLS